MSRIPGLAAVAAVVSLAAFSADAALLRPYDGLGSFTTTIDVQPCPAGEDLWDLQVVISVRPGDLIYVREQLELPMRAQLEVSLDLAGADGATYAATQSVELVARSLGAAQDLDRTEHVVVTLPGVGSPGGELTVRVEDLNQERRGVRGFRERPRAFSETHCYWIRPDSPLTADGLALGDPLFLKGYPVRDFLGQRGRHDPAALLDEARDYFDVERLYGLSAGTLQVAFTVYPPAENRAALLHHAGLRLEILSRELRYSRVDTLRLRDDQVTLLGVGRPTLVIAEVDVETLPPGTFLLNCAPLGPGNGWVAEFDVVWSMGTPRRRGDEELALATLLLDADKLARYRNSDAVGRLDLMNAFWAPLDPEPDTPQNEAWIEFSERAAYVRQFLGGYGQDGSLDPRAAIYLQLGTPNRIAFLDVPAEGTERRDPDKQTLDDFAFFQDTRQTQALPVGGSMSPGAGLDSKGFVSSAHTPSAFLPGNGTLGVGRDEQSTYRFPGSRTFPMSGAYLHYMARHSRGPSRRPEPVLETWTYGHGGFPLCPGRYSDGMPMSFEFFFDPTQGTYVLREVRNVAEGEDSAVKSDNPG